MKRTKNILIYGGIGLLLIAIIIAAFQFKVIPQTVFGFCSSPPDEILLSSSNYANDAISASGGWSSVQCRYGSSTSQHSVGDIFKINAVNANTDVTKIILEKLGLSNLLLLEKRTETQMGGGIMYNKLTLNQISISQFTNILNNVGVTSSYEEIGNTCPGDGITINSLDGRKCWGPNTIFTINPNSERTLNLFKNGSCYVELTNKATQEKLTIKGSIIGYGICADGYNLAEQCGLGCNIDNSNIMSNEWDINKLNINLYSNPCAPFDKEKRCDGDNLYYYDNCGYKGVKVSSCEFGCSNGACKDKIVEQITAVDEIIQNASSTSQLTQAEVKSENIFTKISNVFSSSKEIQTSEITMKTEEKSFFQKYWIYFVAGIIIAIMLAFIIIKLIFKR